MRECGARLHRFAYRPPEHAVAGGSDKTPYGEALRVTHRPLLVIVTPETGELQRRWQDWASDLGWAVSVTRGWDLPVVPEDRRVFVLLCDQTIAPEGWLWRWLQGRAQAQSRVVLVYSGALEDEFLRPDRLSGTVSDDFDQAWLAEALSDVLRTDVLDHEESGAQPSQPIPQRPSIRTDVPAPPQPRISLEDGAIAPARTDPRGASRDLNQLMLSLSGALRDRWGITRVRLYAMEPLYSQESSNSPPLSREHIVRPLWQTGSGFDASVMSWRHDEFVMERARLLDIFRSPTIPWNLGNVSDADPGCAGGCRTLRWGNAQNRAWVPVWDRGGAPCGLLTLDRRTDHQLYDQAAMRPYGQRISEEEMSAMMGDTLASQIESIANQLDVIAADTRSAWDEILTQTLDDAAKARTAREGLTQALIQLASGWEASLGNRLRDLYVVRVHNDGNLQAWAGTGAVWNARNAKRRQFRQVSPYDRAASDVTVLHDVQSWLGSVPPLDHKRLTRVFGEDLEALRDLGSWLGLPLHQGDRRRGILVVGSDRSNYFCDSRVQALQETAMRLMPLYVWDLAQAQTYWMARALAHQIVPRHRDLARLLAELPTAQREVFKSIFEYQDVMATNIRFLGDDQERSSPVSVSVADCIQRAMSTLAAHHEKEITVDVDVDSAASLQVLGSENAIFQAIFTLLDNACKYGVPSDPVRLAILSDQTEVRLRVQNTVASPIPREDRERIFQPFERGTNPASATGSGIGLAVVHRLCEATEMSCELARYGDDPERQVCFELRLLRDTPTAVAADSDASVAAYSPYSNARKRQAAPPPPAPPAEIVSAPGAIREPPRTLLVEAFPAGGDKDLASQATSAVCYVDDEPLFLDTLNSVVATSSHDVRVNEFIGHNAVELLMTFVDRNSDDVAGMRFLLDINMPVPARLKYKEWPERHIGDHQFCGLALAKWLASERGVPESRIALLTVWRDLKQLHEEELRELQLRVGPGAITYIRKENHSDLAAWLDGRVP